MDYKIADLPSLITAVNQIATDTKSTFGHLSPSQLNWKPAAERWSVGQCFDHLITSNIDDVLAGKKRTLWQRMPLLPGLVAKLFIKSLDPANTRKIKAPKRFEPAQSDITAAVIDDFIKQQTAIVEKMKATEHLKLEKIVITSPAAAAIIFSLMDAYRILVVHEHRHFQQAKRVTNETTFPK